MAGLGKHNPLSSVEWLVSDALVPYPQAVAAMEERLSAIQQGTAPELVWLLEHPPLYTAGTSAKGGDLLNPRFPVYETGRGGQYTYHGPGQLVAYVMLDLNQRGRDVRCYVHDLEEWVIRSLRRLNVEAVRREGRVGLWVPRSTNSASSSEAVGQSIDDKIAAVGVRIKRWVTMHGIAINVAPDLSHYNGIIPCGIREHGVTSLAALGKTGSMAEMREALQQSWDEVFGLKATCQR